ncbi:MAG TPA: nucleotide sugar dehydrogenase [Ktedonobacter sp.]|nr:nucleotide sugar dehydrogenase [Ktedonobacter sp.]
MHSNDTSTVAVVGLGKIGLPLAVQYALQGWHVIGCDINEQVVETVNAGRSHVHEEPELAYEVPHLVASGMLRATQDIAEAVRQAQVVVVIVPVIIDEQHKPNFTSIDIASSSIGANLQPDTLVLYETTLPVGTTSQRLRALLERASRLKAGKDFLLAYSPERVSSGHIFRDLRTYPKVIGGIDARSTVAAETFYRSVLAAEIIPMASTDEAEFVKLIETTYRDVNIALASEYARFADMHSLDVTAAIAAANTQPYSHIHTPGVGVGGHCIPVYPYFLLAGVEEYTDTSSPFPLLHLPRSARAINDAMADYAVSRVEEIVGSLFGQSVLMLGVAYRGDVRETAFTSAKLLQEALLQRGATIYVDDPLFTHDELHQLGYTPFTSQNESHISAVMLQAAHKSYDMFDFSRLTNCGVVLDGRRALSREHQQRIVAQGMRYIFLGDGKRDENISSVSNEENEHIEYVLPGKRA